MKKSLFENSEAFFLVVFYSNEKYTIRYIIWENLSLENLRNFIKSLKGKFSTETHDHCYHNKKKNLHSSH